MALFPFMKRVLFFAPFGQFSVHHQLDAVLAAALRLRGAEVQVIGCDGVLTSCDILAWADSEREKVCANCTANSQKLFRSLDLPLRQLREFISPVDVSRAAEWAASLDIHDYANATWNGKPIGAWATSSTFSHFRITAASLHRPDVRLVHQGYLQTALLTYLALSRMVEEFPPDAMCIFNGRMAPYRVAFEVARERGIRILGHERGGTPGAFTLYENGACTEPAQIFRYVGEWMDVPLSPADIERCAVVTRQQFGANMNYPGFYDFLTEAAEVRQMLDIPANARILGVFTSSEFELAHNAFYSSITSQLDYIDQLIEIFRDRPNDYLVVRHHPNIAGTATIIADHDFLRRAWQRAQCAPPNVRIVMPSEKFSSYGLIPHLSGAISFFSSTGQESIARGVAAAALPQSYSHQSSTFIIKDTSEEGWRRLVDDLFARTAGFKAEDLRVCYRYLAATLERHSSKFQSLDIKDFFTHSIQVQAEAELAPGRDRTLDQACEFLLDGTPIFLPPGAAELSRSTADEEAFFASEMERLSQHNWREIPADKMPANAAIAKPVAVIRTEAGPLPLWWQRSRHRALVDQGVVAGGPGFLDRLRQALDGVAESYVLVADDAFAYDESFVRGGVLALEAEPSATGYRIGGWMARANGWIDAEVFTPRHPCADFYAACVELPAMHRPETVLSVALLRTAALKELLAHLPAGLADEEAAQRCFDALRQKSILTRQAPLAMITQRALKVDAVVNPADTPVLFMIFNRPDLTQHVFQAIRAQRPRQLFIAADGPRRRVRGERARCEQTRRWVLDHIDWDCEVKTLFREENLGCKVAVAGAIDWFFQQVPEGIILEDDCLPEPDFFRFCAELLRHYRDDPKVAMIGGVNFQRGRQWGAASHYFSKYSHIWGWASWRRAWQHYSVGMEGLDDFLASAAWKTTFPNATEAAYWEPVLRRVRDGLVDTWDYQWSYAIWRQGGLVALPQVNLVSNLGFRSDATHTTQAGTDLSAMKSRALEAIDFPDKVEHCVAADAFTFNTVFHPPAPAAKKKPKAKPADKKQQRQLQELASLKGSLAWRLVGKHLHSLEKRLGGRRGD